MCGKDTLKLETNAESSKVCSTSQHSSFQQCEVSGIAFLSFLIGLNCASFVYEFQDGEGEEIIVSKPEAKSENKNETEKTVPSAKKDGENSTPAKVSPSMIISN